MSAELPMPFPTIKTSKDYNPAIRLFGKRFIKEQTILEYATEFLALVFSDKRIGNGKTICTPLPSLKELKEWSTKTDANLHYNPPVKLNLKLFAFLSSSRVDSRHIVHKEHYGRLVKRLEKQMQVSNGKTREAIECIEEVLRSLQGVGLNRAWCAQVFFPISKSLLTKETIWNKTRAKKGKLAKWRDSIDGFKDYYSTTRHDFMARGGELLYLQLCNVFGTDQIAISDFAKTMGFSPDEIDLEALHRSLQIGLQRLSGQHTEHFDRLVDYIESLDTETHDRTNQEKDGLTCEWCPKESWREGYLFAVEMNRLLNAMLNPVERLELFMTGCALQVLRSLCAQSLRYTDTSTSSACGNALGYAWVFSPPDWSSSQQRQASKHNLEVIQGLIQRALRHGALKENAGHDPQHSEDQLYREADSKYGHKLFLSLGKKLGIVVPQKGPGARFIMTDRIARYMVLALLPPDKRCTYDDFLRRLYMHYGIALEGAELNDALVWSGFPANSSVQAGSWLAEMLRAGGFLTELSDACSIVHNTFGRILSE